MLEQRPSHGRLMNRFNALGPYLRHPQSDAQCYFFDCLSECTDPSIEPEQREFYGWWFTLNVEDEQFEYCYWYGFYDVNGNWQEQSIPAAHQQSVQDSLQDFYAKLVKLLEELELPHHPSSQLDPSEVLAA